MQPAPPRSSIPKLSELTLVIDAPRLTLRPQRESDAESFFPYVSDRELPKYVTWAPHTKIEETREWLSKGAEMVADGTDMIWVIEHERAPVGAIGLHGIKWGVRAVR